MLTTSLSPVLSDPPAAQSVTTALIAGAFVIALCAFGWLFYTLAAKQDQQDSDAWLAEREAEEAFDREQIAWRDGIESFEYREPNTGSPELDAAIIAWRDAVPPAPTEKMWQNIAPKLPQYPRGRVSALRQTGEPS